MQTICQIKQLAREFNLIFDHYQTHLIDLCITHPLFPEPCLTVFRFRLKDNKLFRIYGFPLKILMNSFGKTFYTIQYIHFKDNQSLIFEKDGNMISYNEIHELLSLFMEDVEVTYRQQLISMKISSINEDF